VQLQPKTAHDPRAGGEEPAAARDQGNAAPAAYRLSLVIPVLNEEKGLKPLLDRLVPVLAKTGAEWDVIFVDDGSRDLTLEALKAAHDGDGRIKAISLSRNFGKEVAVAAGLRYATDADAVILMDADLQHPPEMIPALIGPWRGGVDIVYGVRNDREADTLARKVFARFYYRFFRMVSGTRLPKGAGDFRLLSRRAVASLNRMDERARFNKGLYAWIGFKTQGIAFDVPERAAAGGTSRWAFGRLLRFALDGLASFSTVPLRVSSYLGLAISLFAFSYAATFIIKTMLFGEHVAGFPTLIVSIMFFSGAQLISLGIIGEYIGRIYDEVKARPLYLVAEEVGLEPRPEDAGTLPVGKR
jgi:polyisoprenyl-phosphate glycosyltransferase